MAFSHGSHRARIAQFVEAVVSDTQPVPGGQEALGVQVLIDAILTSAREKSVIRVEFQT